MTAQNDINLTLVLEIEKYPTLYNYKLAEYSRRDVAERTWSEISKKLQLSVNECKEKWRNIRSAFLRSLKLAPSGSKPKKPYYLKEHLSFILPYVKPGNEAVNRGNIPSIEEASEAEAEEQDTDSVIDNSLDSQQEQLELLESPATPTTPATPASSQLHGTRRRRKNDVDTAMLNFLNKKIAKNGEPKESSKTQSMNHFFLSLLPEFNDMSEQQIRKFKIRILQLIDDIKQGQESSTPSTSRESYCISFDQALPSPVINEGNNIQFNFSENANAPSPDYYEEL